jgi:hypothetical protein
MDTRTLTETLHMPSRRETLQTLGAGLLVAAICWYFGVDVWHAILLGCAITVTALACLAAGSAPDARDLSWRSGKRAGKAGSRNDVSSLSSSLHAGWGLVGLTAERRLHEIARRRLALEGLDLQNADQRLAIESRIGAPTYRILMGRKGGRLRLRTLTYCLDAIDAIDSNHYPMPQPRARRWTLQSIPFTLGRARER